MKSFSIKRPAVQETHIHKKQQQEQEKKVVIKFMNKKLLKIINFATVLLKLLAYEFVINAVAVMSLLLLLLLKSLITFKSCKCFPASVRIYVLNSVSLSASQLLKPNAREKNKKLISKDGIHIQ